MTSDVIWGGLVRVYDWYSHWVLQIWILKEVGALFDYIKGRPSLLGRFLRGALGRGEELLAQQGMQHGFYAGQAGFPAAYPGFQQGQYQGPPAHHQPGGTSILASALFLAVAWWQGRPTEMPWT